MEIKNIDEKGFIIQFTQLLEDTCILLFYQYKEQLTEQELIKYMKRLVEYQDTILYERPNGIYKTDTKNCILNLMDTAFRNKDIKYNIEKDSTYTEGDEERHYYEIKASKENDDGQVIEIYAKIDDIDIEGSMKLFKADKLKKHFEFTGKEKPKKTKK